MPAVNIIGFDGKAANVCCKIGADLEKKGMPLDFANLKITAITIANDFNLVTGNTKHFEQFQKVRIENWLQNK